MAHVLVKETTAYEGPDGELYSSKRDAVSAIVRVGLATILEQPQDNSPLSVRLAVECLLDSSDRVAALIALYRSEFGVRKVGEQT